MLKLHIPTELSLQENFHPKIEVTHYFFFII